jgi:hypothetical protein
VFIMDPLIRGADYQIPRLLRRSYPAARADSLYAMWQAALARPGDGMRLTQTRLNR